jgi:hypothetical protein
MVPRGDLYYDKPIPTTIKLSHTTAWRRLYMMHSASKNSRRSKELLKEQLASKKDEE